MNAAADDLTKPLTRAGRPSRPAWWGRVGTSLMVLGGLGVFGAFLGTAIYGDPRGGRPVARTEIAARPPADPVAGAPSPPADHPGRRDAGTVEAQSGVSVVRPPGSAVPGSIVVQVPDAAAPDADPQLLEQTRHGMLPRIGPDGTKPLQAYARPPGALPGGAVPVGRIAMVVGGLGISRSATEDALARLPDAVTLALAPYGEDLGLLAGRARAAGHEIVLQIPMEPFDYPDSDPGPHTLLAGAKPAENIDHLNWAMGRFTGYVALMNYMGAKLTADERALAPVLREAGRRGLGFLDDGSSSRSRLMGIAGETRAARATVVIDAVPRAEMIDKALEALEAAARSGRIVVASASALPVTTERLSRWIVGLDAKGILLVPVSVALAARARDDATR